MSFENGKGRKPDYRIAVKTLLNLRKLRELRDGRKPDYRIAVKTRTKSVGKQGQGVIGAAWKEDDGSISISLSPCVVLRFEDDVGIKLFPIDPNWKPSRKTERPSGDASDAVSTGKTEEDDDTPF